MLIYCRKRRGEKRWRLDLRWYGAPWIFLVWGNIFWKGENLCLQSDFSSWSYFVLQHSGLFCLFVIYDEVNSPLSPWWTSLRNSHLTPSFPSTFNQHWIGIRYMDDMKNSLPCWGKCKSRYWIRNRHNLNTKVLIPKIISSLIHFANSSTAASLYLQLPDEDQKSHQLLQGTRRVSTTSQNLLPLPQAVPPLFRKQSLFSIWLSIKKLEFYFSLASNLCFGQCHKIPQ